MAERGGFSIKGLALVGLAAAVSYGGYKLFFAGEKLQVGPHEGIGLVFTWRNRGDISFAPEFRLDIRRQTALLPFNVYTWQEGEVWFPSPYLGPGEESDEITAYSKKVPSDWIEGWTVPFTQSGNDIDLQLVVRVPGMMGEHRAWFGKAGAHVS